MKRISTTLVIVTVLIVFGCFASSGVASADQVRFPKMLQSMSSAQTVTNPGAILTKLQSDDYKINLYGPKPVSVGHVTGDLMISQNKALDIATSYLKSHYPDFNRPGFKLAGVTLVDAGDAGKKYRFDWIKSIHGLTVKLYVIVSPYTGTVEYIGSYGEQSITIDTGNATA